MEFWLALLLFSSLFYEGYSCSCVSGYQYITRAQTICTNYFNSPNVYKATVDVAYCKCLPDLQQRYQFSCIKFWKRGEEIVGAAQSTYTCNNNTNNNLVASYSRCSNVISSATNMDAGMCLVYKPVRLYDCNTSLYLLFQYFQTYKLIFLFYIV